MVFTLKGSVLTQDGKATSIVTLEFVAEDLQTVLDRMSEFLRGCGYHVGYLNEADEAAETDNTPLLSGGGTQAS